MTIGEFWGHVTTLCHVFDCRVSSGPRSARHNSLVGGVADSFHLSGLGADLVGYNPDDRPQITKAALRIRILVIDEHDKKKHLHLQPK